MMSIWIFILAIGLCCNFSYGLKLNDETDEYPNKKLFLKKLDESVLNNRNYYLVKRGFELLGKRSLSSSALPSSSSLSRTSDDSSSSESIDDSSDRFNLKKNILFKRAFEALGKRNLERLNSIELFGNGVGEYDSDEVYKRGFEPLGRRYIDDDEDLPSSYRLFLLEKLLKKHDPSSVPESVEHASSSLSSSSSSLSSSNKRAFEALGRRK